MTRVQKIARLVAALAALWTVAAADWPVDGLIAFVGGIRCC
jgi:hypothetical protein